MKTNYARTKIDEGGRIVLPAKYRKALGLKAADRVVLTLQDDEIRVVSAHQAIVRAQTLVRRYVPKQRSLSYELIRERKAETAR